MAAMKWTNKERMGHVHLLFIFAFLFELFFSCESRSRVNTEFVSSQLRLNDSTVVPNQFESILTLQQSKTETKGERKRFVAEWEFVPSLKTFERSSIAEVPILTGKNPSRRMAPATWNDQQGNWYVYGGSQFTTKDNKPSSILSDLWKYSLEAKEWELIFKPEDLTQQQTGKNFTQNLFTSAFPENLSLPLLCGSKNSRRFAVHGVVGGNIKSINSRPTEASSTESSPFTENNIIWLYDLSESTPQSSAWTSYVCCDACLPDANATSNIDFCPQFTKETLSWCDHSGLILLQPGPVLSLPRQSYSDYSTASTKFLGGSESESEFADGAMAWWKFDLDSAEWVKLPPIRVEAMQVPVIEDLLQTALCRVVKTSSVAVDEIVYFLCSKQSLLNPSVIAFDPSRGILSHLGGIRLNSAFADNDLWHPARSTLHAVHLPQSNATIILIAYKKLLDMWIHDLSKGSVSPLENIWKGKALRAFQIQQEFYELSLSMESSLGRLHKFYMVNPRYWMTDFRRNTKGHFKVTLVSDQKVFLPQRDAAGLTQSIILGEKIESHENLAKNDPVKANGIVVSATPPVTSSPDALQDRATTDKNEIGSLKTGPSNFERKLVSKATTYSKVFTDRSKTENRISYSQHVSKGTTVTTADIITLTTSTPHPFNETAVEILSSSQESLGSKTHTFNEAQEVTTSSYQYQQSETTELSIQQGTAMGTISVSSLTSRSKKVIPRKKLPSLMNTLMKTDTGGNGKRNRIIEEAPSVTTVNSYAETLIELASESVLATTSSASKFSQVINSATNTSRTSLDSFTVGVGERVKKIKLGTGNDHDHYLQTPDGIVSSENFLKCTPLPGESSPVWTKLVDPTRFFALMLVFSLSIFLALFLRDWVKYRPIYLKKSNDLITEQPPNGYVNMPLDCSLHTPIV